MDAAIELVPRTTIPGSSRSSSKALLATELEQVPVEFHGGPQTYASNETSLLPVDTGFGAWSFVCHIIGFH